MFCAFFFFRQALSQVGTVSVDGTKIQASASKHAAVSYQRAGEMLAQLELEVNQLMERAQQAEAQAGQEPLDIPAELKRFAGGEDHPHGFAQEPLDIPAELKRFAGGEDHPHGFAQEPLDIPAELKRRESRQAALQKARQVIEARAKEMAAAQQADYQAKQAARQAQRDAGKKPRGPEPTPPSAEPDPKAQYNFTDPESRIMKAGNGHHFEQAYNAQAAVDEAMLIVGQRVSDAPNDKEELVPSVAVISPVVAAQVEAVLVDSGFYSEAAVSAVEQKTDGTPSGVIVYAAVEKHSHHKSVEDLLPQAEPVVPGPEASAKEQMAHRLKTAAGKSLYKLRKQTVEPVFGIIKEVMGFRRFLLRGRVKAGLEWTLVCVSYNLKRLCALKNLARAG